MSLANRPGNWFESNQTKSVIIYTLTIAAATWACLYFILDENRINLYRAQKESIEAENKTLEAKLSIYQEENARLRDINQRYLEWLQADLKSIPAAEKRISALTAELQALKNKIGASPADTTTGTPSTSAISPSNGQAKPVYSYSATIKKGGTFSDPKTDVRLGIDSVRADYSAAGMIYIPGTGNKSLSSLRPGSAVEFNQGGKPYLLTVDEINYLSDSAKITVEEARQDARP